MYDEGKRTEFSFHTQGAPKRAGGGREQVRSAGGQHVKVDRIEVADAPTHYE